MQTSTISRSQPSSALENGNIMVSGNCKLREEDFNTYTNYKNAFKNVCRQKKIHVVRNENLKIKLYERVNNPNSLWKCIKGKSSVAPSTISGFKWLSHFRDLLNVSYEYENKEFGQMVNEEAENHSDNCEDCLQGGDDILNGPITYDEIRKCITSMKNGKSPGKDGIVIECYKMSLDGIIPETKCLI